MALPCAPRYIWLRRNHAEGAFPPFGFKCGNRLQLACLETY